jgi:hypothetical protein
MGLFDWLTGLFGGKPDETPDDVADRLERIADRFSNAGDDAGSAAARTAADEARRTPTAEAARRVEAEFLRSRGLRPDGRPLKPVVGRGPDADYVRYGTTVRAGGTRAWRYNNPGYVRCSSRSTYYGALGCDGEFAIFPDYYTGVHALRMTLRDEYPGQPLGAALRQHLPPEAGVDPGRVCQEAGLDPATTVDDLKDVDFGAMGPALEGRPGWQAGDQFDRDAPDNPPWVDSAWGMGAEADAASPTTAGEAASDLTNDNLGPAPTDNS